MARSSERMKEFFDVGHRAVNLEDLENGRGFLTVHEWCLSQ